MDRYLIAYLLIFLLIVGLGAAIARARYYSRAQALKRQTRADRIRWKHRVETKDDAP
jgi:hypothetical protein